MHNLTLIKTVLIIILLLTTSGTLLMWCQIEHNIIVPGAVEESVNWLSATWYYYGRENTGRRPVACYLK